MMKLAEFQAIARTAQEAEFVSRFATPVFVTLLPAPAESAMAFRTHEVRSDGARQAFVAADPFAEAEPVLEQDQTCIIPVTRATNSAFAQWISVGRARNCDICLASPGVSKFHFRLSYSERDSLYLITDGGSTNGTYLDGRRLAAQEPVTLRSGSEVGLGQVRMRFLYPVHFYHWLRDDTAALDAVV